jgi:hypothetical protein
VPWWSSVDVIFFCEEAVLGRDKNSLKKILIAVFRPQRITVVHMYQHHLYRRTRTIERSTLCPHQICNAERSLQMRIDIPRRTFSKTTPDIGDYQRDRNGTDDVKRSVAKDSEWTLHVARPEHSPKDNACSLPINGEKNTSTICVG